MFGYIALILLGISLSMLTVFKWGKDKFSRNAIENITCGGILSLLAWIGFILIPTVVTYNKAAEYQAVINKQKPLVKHYEDYIKRLDEKLIKEGTAVKQSIFTSNHDKPVQAIIEARMKGEKALLLATTAVTEAEIELEGIRLGLLGFVVKWVQE